MKLTRMWAFGALAAVVAVGATLMVVPAVATPPEGVTVTQLAPVAKVDEIDAKVKTGAWMSEIRTKGVSDLHVLEVRIAPGGTFGWHSHPGPSLVIVKSGTASLYRGDDPTCTPQVVTTGSSFVDPGGDVHVVRNEAQRRPREHRGDARSGRRRQADRRAGSRQLPLLGTTGPCGVSSATALATSSGDAIRWCAVRAAPGVPGAGGGSGC